MDMNIEESQLKASAACAAIEYERAGNEGKRMLERLFGAEAFRQEASIQKVKSFHDACDLLGISQSEWEQERKGLTTDDKAYMRLKVIAEALNDGWKPTYRPDEIRWYPHFRLDRVGTAIGGGKTGLPCLKCSYEKAMPSCDLGRQSGGYFLAMRTRELADHFGRNFTDIWEEYLAPYIGHEAGHKSSY